MEIHDGAQGVGERAPLVTERVALQRAVGERPRSSKG
jgi:hypothetical protein